MATDCKLVNTIQFELDTPPAHRDWVVEKAGPLIKKGWRHKPIQLSSGGNMVLCSPAVLGTHTYSTPPQAEGMQVVAAPSPPPFSS